MAASNQTQHKQYDNNYTTQNINLTRQLKDHVRSYDASTAALVQYPKQFSVPALR